MGDVPVKSLSCWEAQWSGGRVSDSGARGWGV